MIRFILKTKWKDGYNGQEGEHFTTLDIDVPELQDALCAGGFSESSYNATQLVGVEILKTRPDPEDDTPERSQEDADDAWHALNSKVDAAIEAERAKINQEPK